MLNRLFILLILLPLAACAPQVANRGHLDVTSKLSGITPGSSHKQDVIRLLGTPSTRSDFGPEAWYYISAHRETMGFLKPEVTEQKVLRVQFDANDIVTGVKRYDLKDGKEVTIVEHTTPTEGQELGLWEQLLGNFGRFNSSRKPGASGPASGSPGRPY